MTNEQKNNVVHLSDKAHAEAKAYCKEHGLVIKHWVSSLIVSEIEQKRVEFEGEG